ncbi:MAG TPA: prepilin-type N-terminal cleavage/methylation domain-containing protein [Candidatus Ozemobacteraceae bacterium]|nr:prepilin-type N-terminal cleavage/methylation domain-containing protein [Candidatus Ozemobacteraceae bacterium]
MPDLPEPASRRPGSGITLVEILVALSIASLVMLPIILLFGISEKVTYKSINEVVAANLALQKIEELRSRPFVELRQLIELDAADPADGPFREITLPKEANGVWNSPGVQYAREAKLSFYPNVDPDTSSPDYELQKRRIRIRVIVYFLELVQNVNKQPLHKTFELSTILSDETLGAGLNSSFTPSLPTSNP